MKKTMYKALAIILTCCFCFFAAVISGAHGDVTGQGDYVAVSTTRALATASEVEPASPVEPTTACEPCTCAPASSCETGCNNGCGTVVVLPERESCCKAFFKAIGDFFDKLLHILHLDAFINLNLGGNLRIDL